MAINKQKKVEIVDTLTKSLVGASSLVFVELTKFSVFGTIIFRRQLRDNGVGFYIAKKTLLKRVLAEKGFVGELPNLTGQVGVAYGIDALAPAREVYNFQTTHKDNVSIIGGVYDGAYTSKEAMMAIATIPPLPILRGQFVGMLISPIRSFVVALDQIAKAKTA